MGNIYKKITPSANKTNALLHSYGQQISVEANYSQKDSYQVTNCQRLETSSMPIMWS